MRRVGGGGGKRAARQLLLGALCVVTRYRKKPTPQPVARAAALNHGRAKRE